MQRLRIFAIKIWRISCANALAIAGGLSVIFFVEANMFNLAIVLTVLSFGIFYYAYRDYGEFDEHVITEPFALHVWLRRMWRISLENVLWIFAGLTYIFFVTGRQLLYVALITLISIIMMYIDAYRTIVAEEHTIQDDEEIVVNA